MTETIMFTAFALGVVAVAGLAIVRRSRLHGMPRRQSDGFDSAASYLWFSDSSSNSNDCAPSDAGCDSGGGGSDGGGGGGGGGD